MSTATARKQSTPSDLAGQVAFITGAAHGQGRATALAMAREGVRIAALDVARPLTYPGYPMGSADELETPGPGVPRPGRRLPDVRRRRPRRCRRQRRRERRPSSGSAASTSCSTTRASAATAWLTS